MEHVRLGRSDVVVSRVGVSLSQLAVARPSPETM